jgi:ATP-dependent RNA helicase DDX5/DBP2
LWANRDDKIVVHQDHPLCKWEGFDMSAIKEVQRARAREKQRGKQRGQEKKQGWVKEVDFGFEKKNSARRIGPLTSDPEAIGEYIVNSEKVSKEEGTLDENIAKYIKDSEHIKEATPVQKQGWPIILNGNDAIVISPTGSGKTITYLLPIVSYIKKNDFKYKALVLVPTRELAQQISSVTKSFKRLYNVKTELLHGGSNSSVNNDFDILIATPGRAVDLYQSGELDLRQVTIMVLDECDKMLQMGLRDQLTTISKNIKLNNNPQVILCSATFDDKLREFTFKDNWIKLREKDGKPNGVIIKVDTLVKNITVSSNIKQIINVCAEHKKPRKLIRFIEKIHKEDSVNKVRQARQILIFCNRIKVVLFVHEFLLRQGLEKVAAIHGNLMQEKRNQALSEFRAGKTNILIATDVAARGLHIKNLPIVVSYDFPTNLQQYCHRIGRTGRDINHSKNIEYLAYSFFTRNLRPLAKDLVDLLEKSKQIVDPNLLELTKDPDLFSDDEDEDDIGKPFKDGGFLAKPIDNHFIKKEDTPSFVKPKKSASKKRKRPRGKRGGKKNRKKKRAYNS